MEWYWTILIVALFILLLAAAIVLAVLWIRSAFKGKPIGGPCSLHTDCDGWGPGPNDAACCQNICTRKQADWAGLGYCPNECRDAPAPLGKLGTCGSGYSWPRKENQTCDTNVACEGWVAGKIGTLACCNGTCKKQETDYLGVVGFCPEECMDAPAPLGKPGSCGSGNSWPRKENQPCDTNVACEGWVAGKIGTLACCNGTCKKQLADYAGILGFCPGECRDAPAPLGKPGSCGSGNTWPRKENQPCDTSVACEGWVAGKIGSLACCNGTCKKQLADYGGVLGFCPEDCRDAPAPLGKPGSCTSGNSWPRKEGQPCDSHIACEGWVAGKIGALACCNGTCKKQITDYIGALGFCPEECKRCLTCNPGTC